MAGNIYRLPPCPSYDIAGQESWLEDMAPRGLFPVKFINRLPLVIFCKAAPKALRYRLEPMPKPASFWNPSPEPSQDMLELATQYSWEYIGRWNQFFVYCSEKNDARELNTEPEVQALSLNILKKSSRRIFLYTVVYLLFLGFLLAPGLGQSMVTYGSVYILLLFLLLTTLVLENGMALWKIHRLQTQLRSGSPMSHQADWRKGAQVHKSGVIASYLLLAVLVGCWLHYGIKDLGLYEHPLAAYPGTPPFVTLDELNTQVPEVTVSRINNGVYESWSDPLFPVCITWLDGGSLSGEGGAVYGGLLEVQYCEALSPWLAKSVATGYMKAHGGSDVVFLEEPGLDYAASFTSYHGFPRAVLVNGNTVVCVRFSMWDPNGVFTLENWVAEMAANIK